MKDEGEDHEDHQDVHFEVELEVDEVGQNDEIYYLVLELFGDFLSECLRTTSSPSMLFLKNTQTKHRYPTMAKLRIMLYRMKT